MGKVNVRGDLLVKRIEQMESPILDELRFLDCFFESRFRANELLVASLTPRLKSLEARVATLERTR
jgi:hypothetical protein